MFGLVCKENEKTLGKHYILVINIKTSIYLINNEQKLTRPDIYKIKGITAFLCFG